MKCLFLYRENFGENELLGNFLAKTLGTIMICEKITDLQEYLRKKNCRWNKYLQYKFTIYSHENFKE